MFQVSLHGFELIPNQLEAFRKHIADHAIVTEDFDWGAPTMIVRDLNGNELFFRLPRPEAEA